MRTSLLGGLVGALLILVACSPEEPPPKPAEAPGQTTRDPEWVIPSRNCAGEAPDEGRVHLLVGMLGSRDGQDAQFAFDALGVIVEANPKVRRTIVCYLEDERVVHADTLMVLNRFPGAFEMTAHYRPHRVFGALALILGSPPPLPKACAPAPGTSDPDLKQCAYGWNWYLDQQR